MPYKLSAELATHSDAVRAVIAPFPDLIVSGSRDTTAIAWTRPQGASNQDWTPETTFRASGGFVSAITHLPSTPDAPKGYAAAGGQDAIINVYNLASGSAEPERALVGHTQNVCALHASAEGTIISGSWDSTAKVWKDFQLVHDLKGHSASVWAVLALPDDNYLTGSADKTIKHWVGDKCVRTFQGHTDVVRGIVLIPNIGFASCSNSGDIMLWTMEGDLVHTLSGHTSFVYALAVLPNGDLVSSGEDRTARVWHDFENTQTIVHPAISVWAVACMSNGDIVTGASDGIVRVFSEASERHASAADLKTFDDTVAAQARPVQEIENLKTSDPAVLQQPGTKAGQTVMIKNAQKGTIEVYQWDAQAYQWQKIGDVVDAVGSGRRQLYEGKEYDYVFDIDVQEGVPPLKLPYNASENPFAAAQRFLERHELPLTYLDQVANFITTNSQDATLGPSSGYSDPYTGASRYQASSNSVPAATSYVDPYTGASRYQAPSGGQTPAASSAYQDPYTGASRYSGGGSSASAPAAASRAPQILPVRAPILFKTANVGRMQEKINELSGRYQADSSNSHTAIQGAERSRLDEVFSYLSAAVDGRSTASVAGLSQAHLESIVALLQRWPVNNRWPLLDLGRLVAAWCPSAFTGATRTQFLAALRSATEWSSSWEGMTPQRATNLGLVLRATANALSGATPADAEDILAALEQGSYVALNKATRVVYATVLFNASCLALSSPLGSSTRTRYFRLVGDVLAKEPVRQPQDAADKVPDPEAVYRALVGLGNMIQSTKSSAEWDQVQTALKTAGTLSDARIKTVIQDIRILL